MEIKTLYHKLFSGTLDNADIDKLIQHIKTHGIALRDYDEKLTRLIYNGNPSEYISSNPLTTYLSVCLDIYIVDDKNHVICVSKNKKLHNANTVTIIIATTNFSFFLFNKSPTIIFYIAIDMLNDMSVYLYIT